MIGCFVNDLDADFGADFASSNRPLDVEGGGEVLPIVSAVKWNNCEPEGNKRERNEITTKNRQRISKENGQTD